MAGAGQKYRVVDKGARAGRQPGRRHAGAGIWTAAAPRRVVDTLDKLISRCPTVSTFERMAFRHYLAYSDTHLPLIAALDGDVATLRGETSSNW